MTRRRSIPLALVLLFAFAVPAAASVSHSDPAAVAIAGGVMRSLGGRQAWDALPGLCWTFGVSSHDSVRFSRHHEWDKLTGRHRVEGTLPGGMPFVVVHTLGDSTHGAAWIGGRAIHGDSLHAFIRQANAMWVNDSYWFLMPYKLLDPGVTLKSGGVVRDSAGAFDRLALTFDHVGLTPGDRYWVDVSRATHRVERWEMVLQGRQPPPVRYTWEGWERHGTLWFPTQHRQGALSVFTRDVRTVHAFPAREFSAL
jgi:hypothetical protein